MYNNSNCDRLINWLFYWHKYVAHIIAYLSAWLYLKCSKWCLIIAIMIKTKSQTSQSKLVHTVRMLVGSFRAKFKPFTKMDHSQIMDEEEIYSIP